MNNNPLVSIIIPVYNDEKFIRECLDSAVNQTLKNIEIICVNDASTDNSLEIMNEYAKKDSRVRVINRTVNGSALAARKDGVMAARGIFTMFMDQDDNLVPNACETAYNLIVENDVDILWFSFSFNELDEDGELSDIRVYNPYCNEILYSREQIQSFYFIDNDKGGGVCLWNKIYKTELIKLSHSKMETFYCLVPNDVYADFYISYYANKMLGISTEPLYTHYFGRGVEGNSKISLEKFEKICRDSQGISLTRKFLEREKTLEEQEKYLSGWTKHFQNYCFNVCCRRVKTEDLDKAVKILYRYFNDKDNAAEITLNLLTELRNYINWVDELRNWSLEQEKAKEWFLSQIKYKDARIAELEGLLGHVSKLRSLRKIFSKVYKFLTGKK